MSIRESHFKKFRFRIILPNFPYSEPVLVFFMFHTIIWIVTTLIFNNVSLNIILSLSILGILLFYIAKNKRIFHINTQIIVILSITIIPIVYFLLSVMKISNYPADLEMHSVAIESCKYCGHANISNQYLFPDGQIANWYKTDSQYYPDAVHVFLASISQFFPFRTELLIIYFELYGTFVIWPYLVYKVLKNSIPIDHVIPFSILFCSLTIFPLSTIAWGGVNFLYGQIMCLFFLFMNGYLKSYKYIYRILFSVILFFIHPSGAATFIFLTVLFKLSKLNFKRKTLFKKIWLLSLCIAIMMLSLIYYVFTPLIKTQFAPSFGSFDLINLNSLFPIVRFLVDFYVIGSINASNFGYTSVGNYLLPISLFLFYYFYKSATKSLRAQILIICILLIVAKLVGVNVAVLHDVSRILTFPWNSHPNRFFSVIIIFMIFNFARLNFSNSHFLTSKSFGIVVVINFLYINFISLNAYFV